MSAEKKKKESEKKPKTRQDTSSFRFNIPIGKEFGSWVAKILTLVFAVVLASLFVVPLKWALGIYAIEEYLNEMQTTLTSTEDTIFSYKYDFYVSDFNAERAILMKANGSADIIPEEFFSSEFNEISMFRDRFSAHEWKLLLSSRARLQTAVKRVFYFSAAPEAGVILDYELGCFTSTGFQYTDPVGFSVAVNNHNIEKSSDWRGRKNLDKELKDHYDAIPTSDPNYSLRKHTLTLSLFNSSDALLEGSSRKRTLKAILNGDIERCAFDAMIFVRDLPTHFKRRDMITWIQERTGL